MSGDLNSVQDDEFIENLKCLSTTRSLIGYADSIKELHRQLKRSTINGLGENKPLALKIIKNLHHVIPLFDKILSSDNKDVYYYENFVQTKKFLDTLVKLFNGTCFFGIFGLSRNTSLYETVFQTNINLLKEKYFTDDDRYDDLVNCILHIVIYSSLLIRVTEDSIPVNLVPCLLKFVNRNLLSKERELIVKNILSLIKCFAKSPLLTSMIIRYQWPQACVQWLFNEESPNLERPSYTIEYYMCLIIQKLARHSIGVEILNELNCLKQLAKCEEPMKRSHTESEWKCLKVIRGMIYALLMEPDEIKQLSVTNDPYACHVITELISYITEASRTESFSFKCFHVSEMLSVLSKLFVNDDVLLKFVNDDNQFFNCLSRLVIDFDNITRDTNRNHQPANDEALVALINLLWSISFHSCYHEKFQTNSKLMTIITNIETTSPLSTVANMKLIPRDMCSLKKAAEGILWNLKPSSVSNEKPQQQERQPLAMISYSHSDSKFCRELVEHLSAHVSVWVDYKQAKDTVAHSDDVWEEIARAMEMATVIVLIVSKDYYNSKSCRQELSYASDALKKRIIPIYPPDHQYRACGWLGIRIAGQKYIHFGRKAFTDAIQELASVMLLDQKTHGTQPSESNSCCVSQPKETTVEENKLLLELKNWTVKDVRKWFDDNNVHKDLTTLFAEQFLTGTALIIYARHVKLFYRNEYIRLCKNYTKVFHGKKLNTFDFIAFVDALYRFRAEYDPNSIIEDSYEKLNDQHLLSITKGTDDKKIRL